MFAAAGSAQAGLGTAIEFYNASLRHYFITAHPEEAAALDAGTNVKGWTRTGGRFTVFTDPAPGLSAVCRFFGTPGVGPNSHFYTADAAECAKVKTLPAWTFEEIAFYIPTTGNGDCGSNWPVYRSYYTDNVSDANHRFTVDLTAHVRMPQRRGDVLEGIVMCAPVTDEEREADVVRFLEQATLGPTEALVQEVKAKGIAKWLDEQLAMNVTHYTQPGYWKKPVNPNDCINDDTPPVTPEKYCQISNNAVDPVGWEFFRQSKTAPDQLRLRMAHMWHQILVGSQVAPTERYATAEFQQRLRDHAFATYESLLTKFALAPQIGEFQNWVKNLPEHDGIKPNENFARELLQLFSIGVTRSNEDGSQAIDSGGKPVPNYGQADVETLARVLTGFAYPSMPGAAPTFHNDIYYIGDMRPYDDFHDRKPKSALGGRISFGAGGTAANEFAASIHALTEHPSAPPFIVRQMIQKTITSAPTPGYVSRMVAVFKDDGRGVRGNLAAVTRAMLLDPEARGARKIDSEYGRLKEPAMLNTAMLRALDVTTDGYVPFGDSVQGGQKLFASPTVFNYYPADFTLPGTALPAPEFGLLGSDTYLFRVNSIDLLLYSDGFANSRSYYGPLPYVPNATGTPPPPLTAYLADAANVDALIDRLDRLFLHGAMTASMRGTLVTTLQKIPSSDPQSRVRTALYLVLTSAAYQVQK